MSRESALRAYYRWSDDFRRYLLSDPDRVRNVRRLVRAQRRYIGRAILDLGCGGGVLGFLLERKGRRYLGVDANPDMLRAARRSAKERGSRCRFVHGDLPRLKLRGTFDTVALLGNAICHIPTDDLGALLRTIRRNVRTGTTLIVEYRDVLRLIADGEWTVRGRRVQRRPGGRLEIRARGIDTRRGVLPQTTRLGHAGRPVRWAHAIWSPFILEALVAAEGWSRIRRSVSARDPNLLVDVYRYAPAVSNRVPRPRPRGGRAT